MWSLLLPFLLASTLADEDPPLRCLDTERCRYIGRFQFGEDRYEVDGNELWVMYGETGGYLRIHCYETNTLDSRALPKADPPLTVRDVNVANCRLPENGSVADLLGKFNITMQFSKQDASEPHGNLTLDRLPSEPPLSDKHFIGFENLVQLHIYAATQTAAEPNFLSQLKNLLNLKMVDVTLPNDELQAPSSLRELTLFNTGVARLPESVYLSSHLLTLKIESKTAVNAVAVPSKLRILDLNSPETKLQLDTVPMLEELTITYWTELHPPSLKNCNKLRKLYVTAPAVHTLPTGWLENCSNLEEVVIQNANNLTALPNRLFGTSHSNLKFLAFKEGALEKLSEGQFDDASELRKLELNGNRLRAIPSNTIPWFLSELDLSSNDFDETVLEKLQPCRWLKSLSLSDNPRLGDVCDKNGSSPLNELMMLKMLFLKNTNLTRICKDWRETMTSLEKLDLSNTSISTLSFNDILFRRTVKAEVILMGIPLTLLKLTRDDFKKAKRTPTSGAFVSLDPRMELECDCRMYWTRRTLEYSPHALDRISELRCTGNKFLRNLLAEDMVCPRLQECEEMPHVCSCAVRPDDDSNLNFQRVRIRCENASLRQMPSLPSNTSNCFYELFLPHNHITEIRAWELRNVKGLDLRNNSLRRVDDETATRLGRIEGVLWLADNPLECDCSASPLLQALHARIPNSTDLENISCEDGRALQEAPATDCPPSVAWLVGGIAIFSALTLSVIAYLSSLERRFFIKAVLHRWGCLCCLQSSDEDTERPYDAFISFSHKDKAILLEMVAQLEPPYRLCLHERDWIPGLRILNQIVDSVRDSHRTIVLLSQHFLASTWARAEFREAHEAAMREDRPRLIVVLLEDPSTLALDDQLQRYIATHTYVRWGDPWFYNKLAVALPRPQLPSKQESSISPPTFRYTRSMRRDPITPKIKMNKAKTKEKPLDAEGNLMTKESGVFTIAGSAMELEYVEHQNAETVTIQ